MIVVTMPDFLSLLRSTAFTAWGVPTSWAELLGFISGAVCVWLVARQNIWNWPIGLVNNALFFILFLTAKLYGDASLQVVFGVLAIYGWYRWLRPDASLSQLPIRRTTTREWMVLACCGVLGVSAATYWLSSSTDSPVPFWDSAVLVLSLLATYGQANKLLESWWIWITVDVISVPLYVSRSLYLTAILYAAFLAICIFGLRTWSRQLASRSAVGSQLKAIATCLLVASFAFASGLEGQTNDRRPQRQVAITFGMMKRRGYSFITVDSALTDRAYQLPDTYAGPQGLSWIHRWALTRGMKMKQEPREPEFIARLYENYPHGPVSWK